MATNGWKVIGIILMIVIFILSIYTVAKMSYSVGYEDGQSGIISLMKISKETKNPIITLANNQNPELTKKIIYFILNPTRWYSK